MATNPYDPMSPMQNEVTHNQRMADVMRMHSLQPIQNVGVSPLSEISPFQGLAQVMGAYASNKMQDRATQGQADLVKAMQASTEHGLSKYYEDLARDPSMANINAASSSNPVIKAIGTARMKKDMGPVDFAKHATDASIIASNGNPQGFAAKDELTAFQPGSLLKDQQGQLRVPTAQPGAAPKVVEIKGNLFHETPTGLDPILKAPVINNNINNSQPVGETAFEKAFGTKEGHRYSEDLQQRPGKIEGISAAQDSLKLLDDGIHTGIFADIKKNLEKGYGAVASKEPEKAARTEQFIANVGNLVIPRLKDFGGSDTVEEMKYLQQVMGGNITLEPKALRNILTSVEKKLKARVQEVDRTTEAYRGRGKTLPTIDTGVQQPTIPEAAPKILSPEDYLKQFGN